MIKPVLTLCCLLGLSACGGGGSSAETPSVPPVAVAPDLLLTADNYQDATPIAFAFNEALLQLSYYSYNRVRTLDPVYRKQEQVCSNGGVRTVDWTGVANVQGQATANAVVTETFKDCKIEELNEVVDGIASISVKADSTDTDLQLRLDFSGLKIKAVQKIVVLDSFDLRVQQKGEIISIKPGLVSNKLRLNFEGDGIYTLSNMQLNHQLDTRTAMYTNSFQTDLAVEGFNSGLSIVTNKSFAGYLGEYPHEGIIQLTDTKGNKIEAKANYVENSALATVAFSGLTNSIYRSWSLLTEGTLWSWPGLGTTNTREFRADNFAFSGSYLQHKFASLNPNDPIVLQFSRELAPSQNLNIYMGNQNAVHGLALNYQIKGSQLILYVPGGMKHNLEYRLGTFSLTSAKGYTLQFYDEKIYKANVAVKAVLTTDTEVFSSSKYPILSAAGSVSKNNLALKYQWSEVSNTGLVFTAPDSPETSFYYPGNLPLEKPRIQLTVTDSQGNSAVETVRLQPYTVGMNTFYIKSDKDEFIGMGQTMMVQTKENMVTSFAMNNNGNAIHIILALTDNNWAYDWNLGVAAVNGETLVPGHYKGAVDTPSQSADKPRLIFSGNGRGCNATKGEFLIHEIAFRGNESQAVLDVLALDLIQQCDDKEPKLKVSIRINSKIPVQF